MKDRFIDGRTEDMSEQMFGSDSYLNFCHDMYSINCKEQRAKSKEQ